jgi:hypothetical protein
MSWGELIEVTTYPTHESVAKAVAGATPSDHEAILAGELWLIRFGAGQQRSRVRTFNPLPQTIARL